MGLPDGKTILFVEDEAITALAETRPLGRYGFRVLCVCSGEEAVSRVERTSDIRRIFMDITERRETAAVQKTDTGR